MGVILVPINEQPLSNDFCNYASLPAFIPLTLKIKCHRELDTLLWKICKAMQVCAGGDFLT